MYVACYDTEGPINIAVPRNVSEINSAAWGCSYVYKAAKHRSFLISRQIPPKSVSLKKDV